MRYPTIDRSQSERLARHLVAGGDTPNWALERSWLGRGNDVSLVDLETAMAEMRSAYADRSPRDPTHSPEAFEGRFSGAVHAALMDMPIEALDDPGFWRYLSLDHFWWFVAEREAPAIRRGNVMTYVDGGKECVPFRMFLRGQAVRSGDDYSLAGALPKAADFWRSHVLRVKTGTAPALTRSFARLHSEKQMVSDDLRAYARRVNRLWSNVVFHVWEEDECDHVLRELYEEMFGADSSSEAPNLEP